MLIPRRCFLSTNLRLYACFHYPSTSFFIFIPLLSPELSQNSLTITIHAIHRIIFHKHTISFLLLIRKLLSKICVTWYGWYTIRSLSFFNSSLANHVMSSDSFFFATGVYQMLTTRWYQSDVATWQKNEMIIVNHNVNLHIINKCLQCHAHAFHVLACHHRYIVICSHVSEINTAVK